MDEAAEGRVILCRDGKYRWVGEKSLHMDLSVLFTILKIFIVISVFMGLLILILDRDITAALTIMGIMIALLSVLSVIGYIIYGLIMGGSYCVRFTMDDRGVMHEQHEKQVKKAKAIAELTILVGALSKNPSVTGTGLTIRTRMYSEFRKVRKASLDRRHRTIRLDGNEVYVDEKDIDMVWSFIRQRCIKAKIVE